MNTIETLCNVLQQNEIQFLEHEPLKNHCTFKIGGNARVFCVPKTARELALARTQCRAHGVPYYVLGKGSNVVFADAGFAGVVLYVGDALSTLSLDGNFLTAGAGAHLAKVCTTAEKSSLGGLSFAYGIPGNVGGAVYMNAGAYGGEIKDVLHSVTFLDENDCLQTLPANALDLGYRTSVFAQKDWCIVQATFALSPQPQAEIRAEMKDVMQKRIDKQPLDLPNAGSTFKRPQGAFAGELIERCGLRGARVGDAQVSEKHCGFVVNLGNATCADLLALTDMVCETVRKETGFILEKEIRVV